MPVNVSLFPWLLLFCSALLCCWVLCVRVVYALTNGCSKKINEIGRWNALTGDWKSILDFLSK